MSIDLYHMDASAPCRSVRLTAKMVGVELNLKVINLPAGEHLKPEFVKINPQHNIPTIVDDDFVLNESRAICGYLVHKYAKDDTLYPKDPKVRALVDQRLYFDMGVFYQSFGKVYVSYLPLEFISLRVAGSSARQVLQCFSTRFQDTFDDGEMMKSFPIAVVSGDVRRRDPVRRNCQERFRQRCRLPGYFPVAEQIRCRRPFDHC